MSNTLLASQEFLTEKQAADYLYISVRTLQNWRLRGGGPIFKRLGARCVRYQITDIEKWIKKCNASVLSLAS